MLVMGKDHVIEYVGQTARTSLCRIFREILSHTTGYVTREDLVADGEDTETLWWYGSDGDTVRLPSPPFGHENGGRFGDYEETHTVDSAFVRRLDGATLNGSDAVVRDSRGQVVLESTLNADTTLQRSNQLAGVLSSLVVSSVSRDTPTDPKRSGTWCSLVNGWSANYFHWVVDCLPKLEGIERYEELTGDKVDLLVPADPPPWLLEALRLAGYDEESYTEWQGGRTHFEHLVVPSLQRERDVISPNAVTWLRDRVGMKLADDSDIPSRIYVSRRDAATRRVRNEDELVSALSARGFQCYVLSELSVAEQVRLFQGADTVVGPHGANLTNILFSTDITLVELFGSTTPSTCYFAIANILNFEYDAIRCAAEGTDLWVDVERVEKTLDKLAVTD
jgi:hypothetical protein